MIDIEIPPTCGTSLHVDNRSGTVIMRFERLLKFVTFSKVQARVFHESLSKAQEEFSTQHIFHKSEEIEGVNKHISVNFIDEDIQLRIDFDRDVNWLRISGPSLQDFITRLDSFISNKKGHLRVVK
jgi:hypothetical protein